ncbi:MAG: TonB-dependent receptor [Prevotella sp.]|nr:TonB-dependent receptor [Prevotella sp.]
MQRLLWLLFSLAGCLLADAQVTVRGVVEDSASHERLAAATVSYQRKGKTLKFTRTNQQGQFALQVDHVEMGDQLTATMMGYDKHRCGVPLGGGKSVTIALAARTFLLKEVKVQGSRVTGRDTITYDLTRFASERDNSLKDVLQKLPGVEVAKNGTISYNGKDISRFTVEGMDLSGGRYNQLTENIRAKDVKKAEIVEHDQPIKALEKRVFTDDVGMNVTLKDEARDKLMATLRPYMLFDDPTHVGGSANIRQIGKKRQRMYDVAYDRKGQDISESFNIMGFNWNRLMPASLPSWYSAPSLSAPIDADRLRFNTSQRYGLNQLTKDKRGDEWRVAALYSRAVVRQHVTSTSIYYLDSAAPTTTTEDRYLTSKADRFSAEVEHKTNTDSNYGNEVLSISASQDDDLSQLPAVSQHICTPQLDISGSLYRLFPLRAGDQLTWKSIIDYHHSVNDLCIDDERHRLRTNLWNTNHLLNWQRKRGVWTQQYEAGASAENTHTMHDNWHLKAFAAPSWQMRTDEVYLSLRPGISLERYARQQRTMVLFSPTAYLNWKPSSHTELTASANYGESTGSLRDYALDEYQRDYRTWYTSTGIIPLLRQLTGRLAYRYKRPIRELFLNASLSASRLWSNATTDMQIVNDTYYYSLKELHTHSDVLRGSVSLSKGFYELHLKTSLAVEGNLTRGQQLSVDQWLDYQTHSVTLTPKLNFAPKWAEVDYEGNFSWQGNKASGQQLTTLFNWTQRLTLTSTINKVDLSWSFVHYRNELQVDNVMNTLLSNASVEWRLKKVRLKAQLRNLFNKRAYELTTYSGISTSTSSYVLRPRELIASAEFNL